MTELLKLLTELPDRLFDGDLDRFAAVLGVTGELRELVRRLPGPPSLYGRADLYHDGTSFKLLEFNVGSPLGGTPRAETCRYLLRDRHFRRFAEEHGLTYVRTGEHVAQALRAAAEPVTGAATPVIGIVESAGGIERHSVSFQAISGMLRWLGFEVVLGDAGQVTEDRGRVLLRGKPIDVALRYFTGYELVAGGQDVEVLLRAHEEKRVVLWTTMLSDLFTSKGCLALLSEERWRGSFSEEERRLIDRLLPWTRTLSSEHVTIDGAEVDLIGHCLAHRRQLIVKPFAEYGGAGIVPGWEVSAGEWERCLRESRGGGFVVQRRVTPRTEPVVDPGSGEIQEYEAVWGVFVAPTGYAGTQIRAAPRQSRAVINMGAQRSARAAPVFEYPGDREGQAM
ncbi:hypothetical protein ACIBIZ_35130 [Nonomuraea spiralis]|uniref:hypothetical protein n=1 Tax=Nonomuraea TaxID=83681 RepID=UPI000F7A1847|nr:hypothetical protein [Nonomuraea sp. WAC 01424]RSN15326.1 hypothetical protein DMB42_00165 [Nonomuraea sp. WAC 01424]